MRKKLTKTRSSRPLQRLVLARAKMLHQMALDAYCKAAKRTKDGTWTWEDLGTHKQAGWIAVAEFTLSQNTELSGGGPLSNKTTEAESRRPLE